MRWSVVARGEGASGAARSAAASEAGPATPSPRPAPMRNTSTASIAANATGAARRDGRESDRVMFGSGRRSSGSGSWERRADSWNFQLKSPDSGPDDPGGQPRSPAGGPDDPGGQPRIPAGGPDGRGRRHEVRTRRPEV